MTEAQDYADALRKIAACCARPFGSDARHARQIARDALDRWGRSAAPCSPAAPRCVAAQLPQPTAKPQPK